MHLIGVRELEVLRPEKVLSHNAELDKLPQPPAESRIHPGILRNALIRQAGDGIQRTV
jgi:hypothetical protein